MGYLSEAYNDTCPWSIRGVPDSNGGFIPCQFTPPVFGSFPNQDPCNLGKSRCLMGAAALLNPPAKSESLSLGHSVWVTLSGVSGRERPALHLPPQVGFLCPVSAMSFPCSRSAKHPSQNPPIIGLPVRPNWIRLGVECRSESRTFDRVQQRWHATMKACNHDGVEGLHTRQ